jgi:AraC-like DNA-binding protein
MCFLGGWKASAIHEEQSMSLFYEERLSDSPFVETITRGWTASAGSTIRPAASHWHMVRVRHRGGEQLLVVGPLTAAGVVSWGQGAEILWIKFKLGAFMPHLPTRDFLETETPLPGASSQSFWLNGSAWQFPDYDNAETFINRLVREEVLVRDPVVSTVLQGDPQVLSSRTVRHRFLRATGLTHSHIRQIERAQQAESLLRQGKSILDTVDAAGYFDQPHLTRSLKHWVGHTPAEIIRASQPDCHFIQDTIPVSGYNTNVLAKIRERD